MTLHHAIRCSWYMTIDPCFDIPIVTRYWWRQHRVFTFHHLFLVPNLSWVYPGVRNPFLESSSIWNLTLDQMARSKDSQICFLFYLSLTTSLQSSAAVSPQTCRTVLNLHLLNWCVIDLKPWASSECPSLSSCRHPTH